ncbi:PorH family porin [Corynebacterium liangguodongii]|uniref:Uncharacterized protein n=1 Tax=Corynebacterium liangguodongii TaxID=2079535 RepID=A0A2S0WFX2_9CORY|nr:PorH family porin [Corynebacterium liangguodongii]AWB84677.1 hypothetical protein C3E79_09515 [Corynebacterium liangguodongii]PWB99685.1 hypothetical protein DF219_05295 [Corynebacterium liangguodongii]
MDLGTIATQFGDFGKFAEAFAKFFQGFAGLFDTFGNWATDDGDIINNTSSVFEGDYQPAINAADK